MRAFLESGRSIWSALLDYLGLDVGCKPILKTTVYSICFGMGQRRLRRQLAEGHPDHDYPERDEPGDAPEGIGEELADRFFAHYLISDLLDRRTEAYSHLQREGYLIDAFDRRLEIAEKCRQNRCSGDGAARSLLAAQAQSWEMRLMLPVLPVVRRRRGQILVWLHDGVYLAFENPDRRDAAIREIQDTVRAEAVSLGFATYLEREEI